MTSDERRAEFRGRIETLLTEYADMAPGLTMPVLSDWTIVAAFDDVADGAQGRWFVEWPEGQWSHRTAGLLQAAADDVRGLVRDAD